MIPRRVIGTPPLENAPMLHIHPAAAPCSTHRAIDLRTYQQFAERHPEAAIFHHRRWIELLSRMHSMPIRVMAEFRNGSVVAAIPFLQTHGRFLPRTLLSLPFSDCVAPLSVDRGCERRLAESIASDAGGESIGVVLKTHRLVDGFPAEQHWVQHQLDLRGDLDAITDRYDRTVNANLRRAEQRGLRFVVDNSRTGLKQFYRLHIRTRRKLGIPVQPFAFFDQLQRELLHSGLGFVGLVHSQGRAVAAGVVLYWNRQAVFKYAAADPAALAVRPNDFLTHAIILQCKGLGLERLDFGTSRPDQSGLRRFKSKFGAVESPVYLQTLAGRGFQPLDNGVLTRMLGLVIRRAPLVVCRMLGAVLYSHSQ